RTSGNGRKTRSPWQPPPAQSWIGQGGDRRLPSSRRSFALLGVHDRAIEGQEPGRNPKEQENNLQECRTEPAVQEVPDRISNDNRYRERQACAKQVQLLKP